MNYQTDLTKLIPLQSRIRARKGLIGCGEEFSVAMQRGGRLLYAGSDRWEQSRARRWSDVVQVACGRDHVVALLADGTLQIAGRSEVDRDFFHRQACVRSVSVGPNHAAVLLGNGRVLVGGDNRRGQCNTADWPTVTDVVCGRGFTIGLTGAGLPVVAGGSRAFRYLLRSWKNVAGLFTDFSGRTVYAITAEGRLRSSVPLPRAARKWQNLVFAAASSKHIWAVTATGRLLSTDPLVSRLNDTKQYISCAVSEHHALALTRDGQVLSVGANQFGQCSTTRFGELFEDFDEFNSDRHAKGVTMDATERAYQIRLVEAERNKRSLLCGERMTACINADGRVLASVGFPGCKQWTRVRALACGNAHLLALHDTGTVSAEGNDVDGCTAVHEWRNVKAVAAGKYHSLGLCEDGRVLFCGRNDKGQGDVTAWQSIRQICTADDYTVGITHDGNLLVAGTPPFDAALVSRMRRYPSDIVLTATHMVCLYEDGTVFDTAGLTADEGEMRTSAWFNVRAIAAGRGFTVGLCYGGRVLAVGENANGCCNTSEWKHIVSIACGEAYTAGLTADGRVLCTGTLLSTSEREGGGTPASESSYWRDVLALRCGPHHMVGITRSGQVVACGEDADKQCASVTHFTLFRDIRQLHGYGQYSRQIEMEIQAHRAPEPSPEEPMTPIVPLRTETAKGRFAVGMAHTLCMGEHDVVHAEGADDCGQCELKTAEQVCFVAAGPYRSAVILTDGRLLMTGRNSAGQSDARSLNRELESVNAEQAYRWTQISCGFSHTAALRSDGRVYAIGSNPDGRCDTRKWRDVTEVSCGVHHTVARRSDGTCVATGDNRYGQCGVSEWRDVVAVAAGEYHTVGLTAEGRLLAVGANRKGQCDLADLTDIVDVACLPEATLCVRSDGRVVIRGGSGEPDAVVERLRGVVALDTCEYRIAAMTAERELVVIP